MAEATQEMIALARSENRKKLSEIGYQVIDAKNEHVEKGWIVRVPNDDERVLIAASEGDAWDAARDHHARMTSEVTQAASSAEFHQQRGRALDLIDWAINEYREFMLDDDYDAQGALDRIINRLRQVRPELHDHRTDGGAATPMDEIQRLGEDMEGETGRG